MGRCGSCRTQTQHFCFVHQEFVCDVCLTERDSIHGRCVVNTYRKWVQDSSYDWPPACAACNIELDIDGDNIRRCCLHVEHARCVEKSAPPDFACASCGAAILKSINDTSIGQLVCAHIAKMPELAKLLPPVPSDPAPGLNGHVEENCEPRGETVSQTDTRDIYKRPNASLRIIETDAAMVSQVSIDGDDTERQAHEIPPRVLPVHIPGQSPAKSQVSSHGSSAKQAQRVVSGSVSFGAPMSSQSTTVVATPANVVANQIPKAETRIDVGMSKANVDRTPIVPLAFRRERGDMRAAASTSMRKALKLGNRRLFDLRKLIKENKKQVAMAALFVFCIVAVALLMTDDEDVPVTAKPVVEEFQMPHIRVNPALIGHKEDRIGGDAHG